MEEIKAAIVTVSDSRTNADDVSGDLLAELMASIGVVVDRSIVTDDLAELTAHLRSLAGRDDIDLVLTTGGTGISPRDNTPEATASVIDRKVPGISEAIRAGSLGKTPTAMLSRGVSGACGSRLIINLPGSPKAVAECFEIIRPILGHAVAQLRGDTDHSPQ